MAWGIEIGLNINQAFFHGLIYYYPELNQKIYFRLANNVLKVVIPQLDKLEMPAGYYYQLSGEAESEGDTLGGNFFNCDTFQ